LGKKIEGNAKVYNYIYQECPLVTCGVFKTRVIMNQVGGYTLGKVIGMGASSKVRLGIKATSLEKVAVKSIDKLKLADERRTQTEVKVKIRQTLASPQKQAVIREMGGLPENTSDFDKCEVESIESSVECITSLAEEVKLLMRLKHPNIIQIYEVIETSSELHLVL
jgi:serine/threonine protein kinase